MHQTIEAVTGRFPDRLGPLPRERRAALNRVDLKTLRVRDLDDAVSRYERTLDFAELAAAGYELLGEITRVGGCGERVPNGGPVSARGA